MCSVVGVGVGEEDLWIGSLRCFVYVYSGMKAKAGIEGVDTGISKHIMQLILILLMPEWHLNGKCSLYFSQVNIQFS